jgi:hypothetical protein
MLLQNGIILYEIYIKQIIIVIGHGLAYGDGA